jgi:hypothetical protein
MVGYVGVAPQGNMSGETFGVSRALDDIAKEIFIDQPQNHREATQLGLWR